MKTPLVYHVEDGTLPQNLIEGLTTRGFGDVCRSAVICPIAPTTSEKVLGIVVLGLNPRVPFNEDHLQFIKVTSRILQTSLASVVLLEEEIRTRQHMQNQAALVQSQLAEQLKMSQREVELKEKMFQRFAERADIGIFILDKDGYYTYRNPAWFSIVQPEREATRLKNSLEYSVEAEDLPRIQNAFENLFNNKGKTSFQGVEMKLKRHWGAPEEFLKEDPQHLRDCKVWVLCSAYPELTQDGSIQIVGCMTDVSKQKFAEGLQAQRTADALESKRGLESFIDTTSHEMRNPLSAIVQCADGIITSHAAYLSLHTLPPGLHELLDSARESADTIAQCAQHQTRIVDDILTMSKLDSGLLAITPVETQPLALASGVVKMYEGAAKAAGVEMSFLVEDSYRSIGVEYLLLDPTRLRQVLINLITNAIKFTRFEEVRQVKVSVGASVNEQPFSPHSVPYIRSATVQTGLQGPASAALDASSDSVPVYLHFTVRDTGRGLTAQEKELIFMRFSQASPRTHVHYGGSGLGLFISRRLTELQGGAIGFASEFKVGSTFSFYIRTERALSTVSPPTGSNKRARMSIGGTVAIPQGDMSSSVDEGRPQSAVTSPTDTPMSTEEPGPVVHVLIVEDNLVNQRVLAKQLKNLGCIVSVANHGGEALDYIRTTKLWHEPPAGDAKELSVILMDWEMPVMDGLSCVKRIRELQNFGHIKGHIPVIAVTANVRAEQVSQALDAGMVSALHVVPGG